MYTYVGSEGTAPIAAKETSMLQTDGMHGHVIIIVNISLVE